MSEGPTLGARGARIDLMGRPLLSGVELACEAERVALLGDWSPLFKLLSGEAELAAGTLELSGLPARRAVVEGAAGVALLDPPLPQAWTAERVLASGAELAGIARKTAVKLAQKTLERLGLVELGARRVGQLALSDRRALVLAHALLTAPRVLCIEDPLVGLDTAGEEALLSVLARASVERRLLVSLSNLDRSAVARQLAATCTEQIRLVSGVAIREAAPSAPSSRVTVTVSRHHREFAEALASRGLTAHPTHEVALLDVLTSESDRRCWRFVIELPTPSTAAVLDAALETEAGLVALVPS